MKRFLVYSPEYQTIPSSWDPPDPGEYGCDVVELQAESKRDAVMLVVAEMLRRGKGWASGNRESGLPPWAGYKAEEVCNHECHDGRANDVGECACCGTPAEATP